MKFAGINPVAYEEYIQAALEYDFKTCTYPGGDSYGISEEKQCRKAPEGERMDKKAKENLVRKAGGDGLSAKTVAERVKMLGDYEAKHGEEGMTRLAGHISSVVSTDENQYTYKKTPRGDEIRAIQDDPGRADKLVKGFEDTASLQKGGKNAVIEFKNVTDEETKVVWNLLSDNMQNSFKTAGTVPTKDAWKGKDENGNDVHGSNSTERGQVLLKRWMEQGGKDAYSGKPLTLNNADLEHIKPFSKNGRNAETPDNWLWISRGLNTSKGNKSMEEFVGGVRKLNPAKEDAAHATAIRKATEVGGKAELKSKAKDSGFISKLEVAEQRKEIVNTYAKGGGPGGYTRYLATALANQKNPQFPASDKIKFVDKTGPNRGQVKQLLQTNANWKEGKNGSGKMTAAEWISRNYPGMDARQKSQFKQLYNQARTEADADKAAGRPATGGTFTQRLADLVQDEFSGQQY
jgi:hypothetical protein